MPGGRLQPLQIAWDSERKRWFHLLPNEKAPPGDVLHWTGRYQTANTMCISCHTTGFEKRYDAATDSFASRWKEPNVSCQSCHGPGERHVQWARCRRTAGPRRDAAGEPFGLAVDLKTAGAAQQVEVCAACHSRRSELTGHAPAGPAAARPLPAGAAEARPVPRRRPAARRGVRRRLVPAEQDVPARACGCTRLPQRAHRQAQAGGQRASACSATRPAGRTRRFRRGGGRLRHARAPLPQGGLGRCAVRGLPHAGQDLHADPGRGPTTACACRGPTCR